MSNAAGRTLSPRAQYAAFARAVNLKAQDAPAGFLPQPHENHTETGNAALEPGAGYQHCAPFAAEGKPAFQQKSPQLRYQQRLRFVSFGSQVEVRRSMAAMAASFARGVRAIRDPATVGCLKRDFDALGARAGVTRMAGHPVRITVGNLKLVPMHLPRPAAGLSRSEGFSMSIAVLYTFYDVRGHTIRFPGSLYFDALTFGVGRAQVTLSTTGFGSMFPPPLEEGMFKLLQSRALAARAAFPAIS